MVPPTEVTKGQEEGKIGWNLTWLVPSLVLQSPLPTPSKEVSSSIKNVDIADLPTPITGREQKRYATGAELSESVANADGVVVRDRLF